MTIPLVEIEKAAVNLPLEERTHLIASLIASLDSVDESDIDAAWEKEVQVRSSAYHRGDVKAVPAAEALERARRILR
jgi:putative addiction module component (TIGR02574 family)